MANYQLTVSVAGKILVDPTQKASALKGFRLVELTTLNRLNEVSTAKLVLQCPQPGNVPNPEVEAELASFLPGALATIMVGKTALFAGMLTRTQLSMDDKSRTLELHLSHALQLLRSTYQSQVWPMMTDEAILRLILTQHGIVAGKVEGMKISHPQMIQFNCSDWRYVQTRLYACGLMLATNGMGVVSAIKPLAAAPVARFVPGKEGLRRLTITHSNEQLAQGIKVGGWNVPTQKLLPGAGLPAMLGMLAYDAKLIKPLNTATWQQGYNMLDAGEAVELATARLQMNHLSAVSAELVIHGDASIEPGNSVLLAGFGSASDGTALVMGVRHRFSAATQGLEDWETLVEIGSEYAPPMTNERVPRAPGLHVGVIGANPSGPLPADNTLAIDIPALQLSKPTPIRARLSSPYAGKGHGFSFYPQQGDEVVVAFIDEDPCYPVILGSMHSTLNQTPFLTPADGVGIVHTNSEKQLKQSLMLSPATGITLQQELAGVKSSLVLNKGEATLDVDTNATIKAKVNIKLDATAKTEVAGKAGVDVKGALVSLKQG